MLWLTRGRIILVLLEVYEVSADIRKIGGKNGSIRSVCAGV